jgi:hypothetical protein
MLAMTIKRQSYKCVVEAKLTESRVPWPDLWWQGQHWLSEWLSRRSPYCIWTSQKCGGPTYMSFSIDMATADSRRGCPCAATLDGGFVAPLRLMQCYIRAGLIARTIKDRAFRKIP